MPIQQPRSLVPIGTTEAIRAARAPQQVSTGATPEEPLWNDSTKLGTALLAAAGLLWWYQKKKS